MGPWALVGSIKMGVTSDFLKLSKKPPAFTFIFAAISVARRSPRMEILFSNPCGRLIPQNKNIKSKSYGLSRADYICRVISKVVTIIGFLAVIDFVIVDSELAPGIHKPEVSAVFPTHLVSNDADGRSMMLKSSAQDPPRMSGNEIVAS